MRTSSILVVTQTFRCSNSVIIITSIRVGTYSCRTVGRSAFTHRTRIMWRTTARERIVTICTLTTVKTRGRTTFIWNITIIPYLHYCNWTIFIQIISISWYVMQTICLCTIHGHFYEIQYYLDNLALMLRNNYLCYYCSEMCG